MKTLMAACAATVALSACGPKVDVAKGHKIDMVSTGWHDAGPVAGKNKLVPLASFTIRNVSDRSLPAVQLNAVFHRKGDSGEWGSAFVTAAGASAAGGEAQVTLTSQLGYTGTDASDEMLRNSEFVDATVDVFAKYGSTQWTRVAELPIDRQLRP